MEPVSSIFSYRQMFLLLIVLDKLGLLTTMDSEHVPGSKSSFVDQNLELSSGLETARFYLSKSVRDSTKHQVN